MPFVNNQHGRIIERKGNTKGEGCSICLDHRPPQIRREMRQSLWKNAAGVEHCRELTMSHKIRPHPPHMIHIPSLFSRRLSSVGNGKLLFFLNSFMAMYAKTAATQRIQSHRLVSLATTKMAKTRSQLTTFNADSSSKLKQEREKKKKSLLSKFQTSLWLTYLKVSKLLPRQAICIHLLLSMSRLVFS